MMLPVEEIRDVISKPYKAGKRYYSDNIYTFDIESSNMFFINGKWRTFDKRIPSVSYDDAEGNHVVGYDEIEKRACPYIGMFSINEKVYSFRNMEDLEKCLETISNPNVTKYVYVHNLAFEMAFYRYLWIKHPIKDLIALKTRKPIQFYVPYYNIIFRCSLRLTELSLEKCAEQYTNIEKKVGELDYDAKLRSPLTRLSAQELEYCEYDCLVLYETIKYFRNQYGHVKSIPSTQTGTVRRAFRKEVSLRYIYDKQSMVPSVHEFKMLYCAFQGGLTHANALNAGRVIYEPVGSVDECSAYPAMLMMFKYPCERFRTIDPAVIDVYDKNEYAFMYDVTFVGVRSIYYNNYIPASKCIDGTLKNAVYDNGRIVSCDSCTMILTDVDLDIIKRAYRIDKIEIHEVMVAKKDYLPKVFLNFMLTLYENKTRYKNVEGMEEIYMNSKQRLNGIFGCNCTNTIRATVYLDEQGEWHEGEFNDNIIRKKLEEERHNKNLMFSYSTGVWCTAYNRLMLFEKILDIPGLDRDVVYFDTDSLKMKNYDKYKPYFDLYNNMVDDHIKECCESRGIDYYRTRPMDPKGERHPLGHWEKDAEYEEFITLGAKRYAYRKNGKIDITISGVGKGNEREGYARDALKNDLENFNEYLVFDYDHAHKLEHVYLDNQGPWTFTDADGNEYHATWQDGCCLRPTTYSMSLTDAYRALIEDYFELLTRDEHIMEKERCYNGKEFIR